DPNNVEGEDALIARAKAIHQDVAFPDTFESRFRKAAGQPAAVPAAKPAAAASAAEAKPVPAAKPAAVAAAPAPKAAPKPAPPPKVEVKAPRPEKHFAGEVAGSFDEVLSSVHQRSALGKPLIRSALFIAQPFLGALPHRDKVALQKSAGSSAAFSAGGSTALNILHNLVLYPLIGIVIAAIVGGAGLVFSPGVNSYIILGVLVALVEGVYRLKDGIFRAKPVEEIEFRAALYGVPLSIALKPLLARQYGMLRAAPIQVDGFYASGVMATSIRSRTGATRIFSVSNFPRAFPRSAFRKQASSRKRCRITTTISRSKTATSSSRAGWWTKESARSPAASALFRPN